MELVGFVVFLMVAAAAIYYLPAYMSRHDEGVDDPARAEDLFSSSVKVVHDAAEFGSDEDFPLVSTPDTRQAEIEAIHLAEVVAASRRRVVLTVLALGLIGTVLFAAFEFIPWWSTAIPVGLLVLFTVAARVGVLAMRRRHDAIVADIRSGNDERTVALRAPVAIDEDTATRDVVLGAPVADSGSLWGPVAVTKDTYVQQPLGPRTVRTIDLSAPEPTTWGAVPPTADPRPDMESPVTTVVDEPSVRRVVGE